MKCIKCGTVHNDEVCPHCGFENITTFDLPKLKEESNIENVNDFDSLFGDIEPETYSIKK